MSGIVSIIIPAYNYARYLPDTLDSVLAQEIAAALDVIVVDDGSTDTTPEVLARYAGRVRTIRQENRGLSAARNRGLEEARGDTLLFLDADDLLAPGALAGQRAFLEGRPDCQVAVCPSAFFSETSERGPVETGRWNLFAEDLDIHLCHYNIAPPHAFLARREAVGGLRFDEGLGACEDHWFWLGLLAAGATFRANPDALVFYRRHTASMSANTGRQQRHDALMHGRVFELLRQRREALRPQLGLRFLACCAAALWTLQRICCHCPAEAATLAATVRGCLAGMAEVGVEPSSLACWLAARAWSVVDALDDGPLLHGVAQDLERIVGPRPAGTDLAALAHQAQRGLHLAGASHACGAN
jgi:GT2 family glycosyltransferase